MVETKYAKVTKFVNNAKTTKEKQLNQKNIKGSRTIWCDFVFIV